jgi:MoxR-like ATPase
MASVESPTHDRKKKRTYLVHKVLDFVCGTAVWSDDRAICLRPGRSVVLEGPHGISKSASVEAECERRGIIPVVLSLPTIEVSDLYLSLPRWEQVLERWAMEVRLHTKFQPGRPWMFVGDDFRRCRPGALSALMELTNEGSLAGILPDNLVGCVLIDNPVGEGYFGVSSGDAAFESRFAVFPLTAADLPWREWLIDTHGAHFGADRVTEAVTVWDSLDQKVQRAFPPRVLDHVMQVASAGLPLFVGLPILPNGRLRLHDTAGADVTDAVLAQVAAALGVPVKPPVDDLVATALRVATERSWNVHMVGPHGVAKTATVRALADVDGVETHIFSAANLAPGELARPVPARDGVSFVVNDRLLNPSGAPKRVVFDEMFRASKANKPQMLEMFQRRSIAGETLENTMFWAINNPAKHGAVSYQVGAADEALCSRFTVNLEVTADDTRWREYLVATYGDDVARPFIDFWSENLDDVGKVFLPPRVLEIMIQLWLADLDVAYGVPMHNGERLPVRLHDLKARLAGRRVLGVGAIVAEADKIASELTGSDEIAKADSAAAVVAALHKADAATIDAHAAVLHRLVKLLPRDMRVALGNSINGDSVAQRAKYPVLLKVLTGAGLAGDG